MTAPSRTRVVLIGIGGATCSGKTTLAKHLKRILPHSVIIHQDDFAPPQHKVPIHPVHQVQDWDAPAGAIEWDRMIDFLKNVKETGVIPPDHRSHDHLNEQKKVPLSESISSKWQSQFDRLVNEADYKGEKIVWGIVDGFLLYWHPDVFEQLDVRIFLRVPHDILKQRRHERHGYHTAVQSDPEGSLWRDPPMYWEQIVWPAYLEAHRDAFVDGDVESGVPNERVRGMSLINSLEIGMDEIVERTCAALRNKLEKVPF
ncbi:P-loop containing nucleoside triphosphate hydrolase protein [Marasmius fiardii PR-910]|nr:P-loop containing nucleoside triphosphate hydrolase protein [Marasmius fiardii PR-910]